mmetsp:Transcript_19938/g.46729  ORF Transcript_19938/g.46729 Transcript_19938/m.46729 type:complete len:349 (-) Transcript_19938:117-1163(-)
MVELPEDLLRQVSRSSRLGQILRRPITTDLFEGDPSKRNPGFVCCLHADEPGKLGIRRRETAMGNFFHPSRVVAAEIPSQLVGRHGFYAEVVVTEVLRRLAFAVPPLAVSTIRAVLLLELRTFLICHAELDVVEVFCISSGNLSREQERLAPGFLLQHQLVVFLLDLEIAVFIGPISFQGGVLIVSHLLSLEDNDAGASRHHEELLMVVCAVLFAGLHVHTRAVAFGGGAEAKILLTRIALGLASEGDSGTQSHCNVCCTVPVEGHETSECVLVVGSFDDGIPNELDNLFLELFELDRPVFLRGELRSAIGGLLVIVFLIWLRRGVRPLCGIAVAMKVFGACQLAHIV